MKNKTLSYILSTLLIGVFFNFCLQHTWQAKANELKLNIQLINMIPEEEQEEEHTSIKDKPTELFPSGCSFIELIKHAHINFNLLSHHYHLKAMFREVFSPPPEV